MICSICKHECEVVCSGFEQSPFIDGRTYNVMCFVCSQVPKTYDFDRKTSELVLYCSMDPSRLCSVKDMLEDGFNRAEIEVSIRAVKRCLKNAKVIIVSELANNVYDNLFLADEPLEYEKERKTKTR